MTTVIKGNNVFYNYRGTKYGCKPDYILSKASVKFHQVYSIIIKDIEETNHTPHWQ